MSEEVSTEKLQRHYCYALDFTISPRVGTARLLLPIDQKFTWISIAHTYKFPVSVTIQIGKMVIEGDSQRLDPQFIVPLLIDHQAIAVTLRNKKRRWFRKNHGQIIFVGTIEVSEAA